MFILADEMMGVVILGISKESLTVKVTSVILSIVGIQVN